MQRLAVVLLCVTGLFLLHTPANAKETQWIRVASPHLELFTTAEAETASQALIELESLRICFRSAVPASATEPARLRIVAFSSESEYQVFRLNSYSPAYFVSGPGQGTIVLGRLTKESLPSLRHEYIHALVQENGWRLPLWLAEGLAEQFSGVDSQSARFRRNLLKQQGLPSISQLQSVQTAYQDRESAQRFYAASWALTNLLFTESPYRDHIGTFVKDGGSPLSEWLAGFGLHEARLERDLRAQIDRLRPVSADGGTDPIQIDCRVQPADGIAVQLALARLQEQLGDPAGAWARLETLPEPARQQADYWVLRGDLSIHEANADDARYSYEKAMDLGSQDGRMLQQLAVLQQGLSAAVPVLERLVELTPANDEARLVLSSHYLNAHRWPEALAQLRQVKHASPEREDFYRLAVALAESHLEPTPVLLSTR